MEPAVPKIIIAGKYFFMGILTRDSITQWLHARVVHVSWFFFRHAHVGVLKRFITLFWVQEILTQSNYKVMLAPVSNSSEEITDNKLLNDILVSGQGLLIVHPTGTLFISMYFLYLIFFFL